MEKERKFRALVVDDNAEIRKLISWALNREAIACDEANDGVTASNMAAIKRYDVVITDLAMPRMHGHKLIVELERRESPPLILVVTGVTESKIIQDLFQRGVEDVFFKPLTMELFSAKVKALLQRNADRKQANIAGIKAADVSQLGQTASEAKSQIAGVQDDFQHTIENLEKQLEDLETGFLGSVRVLINLIAQAGESRGSHPLRVEKMAVHLGEQFGLSKQELMELKIAGLLHDIGQIGLSDKVRRKAPWEHDPEEREEFQKYPIIGALLLSEIPGADGVAALVESHAENFDGSGFPAGLREAEIPLGARLLRVADGLDTCMMHGAPAQAAEKGQEHLRGEVGKKYDPALVSLASSYLRDLVMEEQLERTQKVLVSELIAGQVIAENLYDERGRLLLRKGVKVTGHVVSLLRSLSKFQSVVVEA